MNVLLELDEDDPDRFYLSGGLRHALEVLQTLFISIIALTVFLFIKIGVTFGEHIKEK
jgi:hypothetical protein